MKVDIFMKAVPAKNANDAFITARRAVADKFVEPPLFHSVKVNLSNPEVTKPDPQGRLLYNVRIEAAVE